MANSVVPQADIGALGVRGLSFFSTILAACSADDVDPTAMMQMEDLGNSFLVSGPYAEKVPDALKRCKSVVVERLAISIGWRKGDSASYMAASAGGQSISLLCLCLCNSYDDEDAGKILRLVSQKLLPRSKVISSVAQMGRVARHLGNKLCILGFGSMLVKQVQRILQVYELLGLKGPKDIMESISPETTSEILELVAKVLQSGADKMLRIIGSYGLGYIVAICLTMFPDDTTVTVNGYVISEGPKRSIVIQLVDDAGRPYLNFGIETHLKAEAGRAIPLNIVSMKDINYSNFGAGLAFQWEHWVKDVLHCDLLRFGIIDTADLLETCRNVLSHMGSCFISLWPPSVTQLGDIIDFNSARFELCCQQILGPLAQRHYPDSTLAEAFSRLATTMLAVTRAVECTCNMCDFRAGWLEHEEKHLNCPKDQAWMTVAICLDDILFSYFIDAGPGATVRIQTQSSFPTPWVSSIINFVLQSGGDQPFVAMDGSIESHIRYLFSGPDVERLICGDGSTTLLAKVLYTLEVGQASSRRRFDLLDGQITWDGRYFQTVRDSVHQRSMVDAKLGSSHKIVPSDTGVHTALQLTVTEGFKYLQFHSTLRVHGTEVPISLGTIVEASSNLRDVDACAHPKDKALAEEHQCRAMATSVSSPRIKYQDPGEPLVASIVQTRQNPVAQLLACEPNAMMFHLKDCCLDCAFVQILALEAQAPDCFVIENYNDRRRKPVMIICS